MVGSRITSVSVVAVLLVVTSCTATNGIENYSEGNETGVGYGQLSPFLPTSDNICSFTRLAVEAKGVLMVAPGCAVTTVFYSWAGFRTIPERRIV
jgi:hypothetical protein